MAKIKENWLPAVNWADTHEVSDRGRVRRIGDDRSLAPFPCDRAGHLQVNLCANGLKAKRLVHRMVLEAFVGECPPGMEGCHRDNKTANNALDNLRWDTHLGNMADSTGRPRRAYSRRLTPAQVAAIRASAEGAHMLAERYNVMPWTVHSIRAGRTYKE